MHPRAIGGLHPAPRRALPHPRVTQKTAYLLVCDGGNPHWSLASYGRKIQRAYDRETITQAFEVVLQTISEWRHDAVGDSATFAKRDKILLTVDNVADDILGPLGDHGGWLDGKPRANR